MTRVARYAVVGRPVGHSLSPVMQRAAFRAVSINATFEAIDAGPEDTAELFARLREARYAGWNVTTPLKERALSLVEQMTEQSRAARSINVIRRDSDGALVGHNTDGAGLLGALRELWSWEPRGETVLVLGTGPAARAAVIALEERGAQIACWSRDAERAARLAPPLTSTPQLVVCALPPDATLPAYIVNAADNKTLLFDFNYGRPDSPIARMLGRARSDGLPLLLHQGVLSFEFWTGKAAPLEAMRQALRAHGGDR